MCAHTLRLICVPRVTVSLRPHLLASVPGPDRRLNPPIAACIPLAIIKNIRSARRPSGGAWPRHLALEGCRMVFRLVSQSRPGLGVAFARSSRAKSTWTLLALCLVFFGRELSKTCIFNQFEAKMAVFLNTLTPNTLTLNTSL